MGGPSASALYLLRRMQTFEDKKRSTLDCMAYSASVGLTAHLDQVLEMPRGDALPGKGGARVSLPAADVREADLAMSKIEPVSEAAPGKPADEADTKSSTSRPSNDRRKRARLVLEPKPDAGAPPEHTNGVDAEPEPALPAQEA